MADLLRNDLVACAMSIVSNSEADFNLLGEWKCRGDEFPTCPECQSPMKYRDTRQRHIRREGGEKLWGRIRRLFCKNCHRLHNELPTNLSPHKHYEVEVIEGVVDEVNASLPTTHRVMKMTVRKEDFKRSGAMKVLRNQN